MTEKTNNKNLPANAMPATDWNEPHFGLTKREEFAKIAMLGILSGKDDLKGNVESLTSWYNSSTKAVANLAVKYADALLKELEK